MLNIFSWWKKVLWKRWKWLLLGVAIIFVIVQVGNMSILGFVGENSNTINTKAKHRQHLAVKKVFSKWDEPQHSKLLKDPQGHAISLRGTRVADIIKYFPNSRGKFTCLSTKEEIDFHKVNDDYCDCPFDGSDEPGTNACNNGVFYCEKTSIKSPVIIPSYRVNDGVCDCCDGSDEWLQIPILDTSHVSVNDLLKYRITQCRNSC